ncbi:porin [Acidovorax sp. GBBC 3334]|uniref:porin n=1 Tax=unclassified Acidovorax TaxID=2684926 RepID=UPI0023030C01|nr:MULTISPECIES: porin [unclassified Acidovorax]MDA8453839.1 porin [Acidovorax sp. GBBC 3334]MDA8519215.1 porin [Acidovorax sp. NCPPB 4044]
MQKTNRLALAVLALLGSTAAFAQSSVTLYGRVNTTVERQEDGNVKTTGVFNNASRFGFKGVEDLGGGLKAGFQLESGFNSDTGSGTGTNAGLTFARQSELNLSGNFGMVRLGRWTAESYYATADYVSLHNHDTGSSSDAFYQYLMNDSNKVGYRTPEFGGFWAEGAVSLHENQNTSVDGLSRKNAYDLAANYNVGALALGAGYTKRGEAQQAALRALYTLGPWTFGGYYQHAKLDRFNNVNVDAKFNNVRLAAAYTMGASEFHVNVGRAFKIKAPGGDLAGTAATQYTLGYNYNLSKRTKVYGYYTKVSNGSNINYFTSAAGNDFSSVAVGVRHNF